MLSTPLKDLKHDCVDGQKYRRIHTALYHSRSLSISYVFGQH